MTETWGSVRRKFYKAQIFQYPNGAGNPVLMSSRGGFVSNMEAWEWAVPLAQRFGEVRVDDAGNASPCLPLSISVDGVIFCPRGWKMI